MMNSGSMRPVQGRRMMRTLLAMCRRLVPARSAPVYVHQLQTKAVMRGSKPSPAVPGARCRRSRCDHSQAQSALISLYTCSSVNVCSSTLLLRHTATHVPQPWQTPG